MVSEASWQTGGSGIHSPSAEGPMDQQSVESLLRRLVQRVEESERRYSEALDDLHARIDQLSRTTDAARTAGAPGDAATFDRLHDQVSSLARRLEQESATPLDDFERLGRALSGELGYGPGPAPTGNDFSSEPPFAGSAAPYSYPLPQPDFSAPPLSSAFPDDDQNLDKRLVEMAHRLEHSIGTAMPAQAIEALNARLDEIGHQIAQALEQSPKGPALEAVEQKISDVARQLGDAQSKLARIGEIETALNGLIERVDGSAAQLDDVVKKAASEAAQRVAEEAKLSAGTAERLDAMHRDLMAMNERTRESDGRLAMTIEAVHESLKKLVLLAEQNASPQQAAKPRVPFAERMRQLDPLPPTAEAKPEAALPPKDSADAGETAVAPAKSSPFKNRLGAAIPDFQENEPAPRFGRAKAGRAEEKSSDLDPDDPARAIAKHGTEDADFATPEDLVAAARRAAQAAALKAESRRGSRVRRLPGDSEASMAAEQPGKRKRSLLIICAAVLLAISALLLYGRLRSKPEPEIVAPPATEQSAPAPAMPSEGSAAPEEQQSVPEPTEPNSGAPAEPRSGAFEVRPAPETNPAADAVGSVEQSGNVTEVAKSPYRPASAEETPPPLQPASLAPTAAPQLPPGVVFAIEDPSAADQQQTMTGTPAPIPQSLPLPPADLGPLSLRQAAAEGDPRAQHAIAVRYAQGQGTPQNLSEAARWLERAASAGLAPAQYRLGAMYERGQGVSKDLGRARSWYQAAAEKGNVKAMHNLAVNLSGRESGNPDYALAAKWYGEAAAYGLADSQFNLGILAEHGLGISVNLPEAYKWFALAATGGDAEAAKRRDQIKPRLGETGLAEAEKLVAAYAPKQPLPEANDVVELAEWTEVSSTPNASLVSHAQSLLNKLGYDVGAPDGLMGARTRDAIKSFERKNGLEETGKVTVPLVVKLERLTS
jgi:localization factor PodJL